LKIEFNRDKSRTNIREIKKNRDSRFQIPGFQNILPDCFTLRVRTLDLHSGKKEKFESAPG
jgi:hypothetical protein